MFKGVPTQRYCDLANKVAGKHGYHIVCYDDPGSGPRGWFAGPNRGSPFDKADADAVMADLELAGLWPIIEHSGLGDG